MDLKRLWDTENKKIVWAIPTWDPHTKLQVWTNDDGSKLYVYDSSKWVELANPQTHDVETYWPVWKSLEDETVGYYLTNEPTDLYNWDSGDEVAYRFMNWTTVLQSWKVDEGETPEYTWDTPTKAATAQYSYTFSWWKPTVGPITKKTDFKAQFTSTVNEYTVSIASNNTDYGTVSESSVADVPYGTALSVADNVLTIGSGESAVEVTATAEEWYEFDSWGELPATVTWDLTITATFKVVMHTVTFSLINGVWDENAGEEWAFVPAASQDPLWWTISPQSVQVPDGFTFTSDTNYLAFYSPDGSPSDDDAVVVNITPDQTISEYMSWHFWDISETSWIEEEVDEFVVKWNVSGFPIIFFDGIDGPWE